MASENNQQHMSPEAKILAEAKHAVNLQIPYYDFLRLKEAAQVERTSVSEIVRLALTNHLNQHPEAEVAREVTRQHFENEAALNALRNRLNPQNNI